MPRMENWDTCTECFAFYLFYEKTTMSLLKCPLRPHPSCWDEASGPSSMAFSVLV